MKKEKRDPAKKVLCTKSGGNVDRRGGRPKLRWCDELHDVPQDGAEIGELKNSEDRSGGKSLRRSRSSQRCCNNGRRNII